MTVSDNLLKLFRILLIVYFFAWYLNYNIDNNNLSLCKYNRFPSTKGDQFFIVRNSTS